MAKGFEELWQVGLLDEEPSVRVSGAQAAGCSPVATAFAEGTDAIRPVKPDTIAKSLAIGNPADGWYALDAIRNSGGACASVTDDEVIEGIRLLARTEGIFAETAGGVTIATLAKLAAQGVVRSDERVVALVTGHGLKTVEALAGRGRPDRHHRPHARGVRPRPWAAIDERADAEPRGAHDERQGPDPHPAAHPHRRRRRGDIEGSTVGEVLKALDAAHAGLRRADLRRRRGLRRFVNVFLADEDVRFLDGLATPVADGQTLSIVPAVAGG